MSVLNRRSFGKLLAGVAAASVAGIASLPKPKEAEIKTYTGFDRAVPGSDQTVLAMYSNRSDHSDMVDAVISPIGWKWYGGYGIYNDTRIAVNSIGD